MKLIQGILKLISFICGVCVYLTICIIAMVGYKVITNEVLKLYPHYFSFTPDAIKVIVIIGMLSIAGFAFSKIKDVFWEPTIKVKITKKEIHNETLEN
jgi:hypothetical protein